MGVGRCQHTEHLRPRLPVLLQAPDGSHVMVQIGSMSADALAVRFLDEGLFAPPENTPLTARFCRSDDATYEFATRIIGRNAATAELLLQWPNAITREQGRRSARPALTHHAILSLTATEDGWPVELVDLSAGGVAFVAPPQWPVGTFLRIHIDLQGPAGQLELEAAGRLVQRTPMPLDASGQRPARYGLEFTGLPAKLQDQVAAWVLRASARSLAA